VQLLPRVGEGKWRAIGVCLDGGDGELDGRGIWGFKMKEKRQPKEAALGSPNGTIKNLWFKTIYIFQFQWTL